MAIDMIIPPSSAIPFPRDNHLLNTFKTVTVTLS